MVGMSTFRVNGEIFDVPENELEDFYEQMADFGIEPEQVDVYRVNGREYDIPESERDAFFERYTGLGMTPKAMRTVEMDDGRTLNLGDEDVRQFVNARRSGMPMSRGLLANTGIPDWYGKSREDREALADTLGAIYGDDESLARPSASDGADASLARPSAVSGKDENFGDWLMNLARSEQAQTAASAAKGFVEGLGRSVTDFPELMEETYGDGALANALKGSSDAANKFGRALADVPAAVNDISAELVGLGERAVGSDAELSRIMRENSAAGRAAINDALPTDTAYVDESLKPYNEFATDTPVTVFKFALPGMAPVAISADTANAFYDSYERALKKGQSASRAEAEATAKAGLTAAMGLVLGKVARDVRTAEGFRGALADMAVTGAEMGALGGADDLVEQGIEGAENPDLKRTLEKTAEETLKGAAFSGFSRASHGIADANTRRIDAEARKTAQERAAEEERQIARDNSAKRLKVMDDVQFVAVENDIASLTDDPVLQQKVMREVEGNLTDARAMDDPYKRERIISDAFDKIVGTQDDGVTRIANAGPAEQAEVNRRNEKDAKLRKDMEAEEEAFAGVRDAENVQKMERDAEEQREGWNAAKKDEKISAKIAEREKEREEDIKDLEAAKEKAEAEAQDEYDERMAAYEESRRNRPQEPQEQPETPEEDYPTVVDKSGKRRLTGIAAQRKAAAEAERKLMDEFIDNDNPGGMMAFLRENGNLMGKPSKKKVVGKDGRARFVYDDQTAGDALDLFFDGMTGAEKRTWERRLFGKDAKNATGTETMGDGALDALRERFGKPDMTIDDALDMLRKEYEAFEEFKNRGGKTKEQLHDEFVAEQERAREVKINGESYDIEDIEARNRSDETYDNAMAEVSKFGNDSAEVQNFSRERLNEIKKGDTIRFDHSESEWVADGDFDAKNGEITVSMKDVADNPLFSEAEKKEMTGRRFRVTDNGWIELKEKNNGTESENREGTDKTVAGDASGKPGELKLEGATAEELAAEQKRIADRKEIESRKNAPLKTGTGEIGQDLLDLGGAEGEDLFNRTVKPKEPSKTDAEPSKTDAEPSKTDDAWRAWAVDKNGKPIEFATKEQEAASRETFDLLVKMGRVDPKTGKLIEHNYADVPEPELPTVKQDNSETESQKSQQEKPASDAGDVEGKQAPANSPSAAYKAASKTLGADAFLPKDDLMRKLAQWKKNVNSFSGARKEKLESQIEAAETILAERDKQKPSDTPAPTDVKPQLDVETKPQRAFRREQIGDPEFVEWAKKNNRIPTDASRRDYDHENAATAAKRIRNAFPNATITLEDRVVDPNEVRRRGFVQMRAKGGSTLGWFNPKTKEVRILPGANAETLTHEVGWHMAYDWAKDNSPELYRKMRKYALDISKRDPSLKGKIDEAYAPLYGGNVESYIDEYGAFSFQGKSAIELMMHAKSAEERSAIGKFIDAKKEMITDFIAKNGGNRIDLETLKSLSPDEMMAEYARQIGEGKTLGNVRKPKSIAMGVTDKPGGKIVDGFSESAKDKWERKLHDFRDPIRTFERDVEKALGRKLNDGESAYEAMRMLPGKFQHAFDRTQGKIAEYQKMLKDSGIDHEDVVAFMQAQAAPERNQTIREKLMKDGELPKYRNARELESVLAKMEHGSGLTDEQAKQRLDDFRKSGKYDALEKISDFLLTMQAEGMQERVDAGLVNWRDAAEWVSREQHHVPFRSGIDADGNFVAWDPRAIGTPEFKEAKGRDTLAGDVVSWMFDEYSHAFSRGAENRARQKLFSLVREAKRSGLDIGEFGNSNSLGAERYRGQKDGNEHVFETKIGGKTISFALNGERGKLITAALNGRNVSDVKPGLKKAMRIWSNTATTWSPTFALRNFTADTVDIAGNYIGEYGMLKGLKAVKDHEKNVAKITGDIINHLRDKKTSAEFKRLYDAYVNAGGQISGFKNMGYSEISDVIRTNLGKGETVPNAVVKAFKKVGAGIEGFNGYFELVNRLAAFKTQREMGMSDHKAALWSRESTVDFNQKGEWTALSNAAWMFSNSTLGASARQMKALFGSKGGKSLAAGLFSYGMLEGFIEALNGDESENETAGNGTGKDMSEKMRATSFYFRNGNKVVRAPFHGGPFALMKYAGNLAARVAVGTVDPNNRSSKEFKDAAKELGFEAASVLFSMLGTGSVNFQTDQQGGVEKNVKAAVASGVPTFAQGLVQSALNTDYKGDPIEKGKFDESTPSSYNGRKSTPEYYKSFARFVNDKTGSDERLIGALDLSPEQYKLLAESFGKNVLRDATNLAMLGKMFFDKDARDIGNVPFARDFYKNVNGNDSRYFGTKRMVDENNEVVDRRGGEWSDEKYYGYLDNHPWAKDKFFTKTESRINALRRMEGGETRTKSGKWVKADFTDEEKEEFKAERRKLQAEYIAEVEKMKREMKSGK